MYEYKVKQVVKVVDGDTLDLQIALGFHITFEDRFRLAGINTPEVNKADSRAAGLRAAAYLRTRLEKHVLTGRPILVQTEKGDKYGRWLATILLDEDTGSPALTNLNHELIEKGYAERYMA